MFLRMDPNRDGLNSPKWFYQGDDHRVYGKGFFNEYLKFRIFVIFNKTKFPISFLKAIFVTKS